MYNQYKTCLARPKNFVHVIHILYCQVQLQHPYSTMTPITRNRQKKKKMTEKQANSKYFTSYAVPTI